MSDRKIEPITIDGQAIYFEVSEVAQQGSKSLADNQFGNVSAQEKLLDAGQQINATLKALCSTVQGALANAQPDEWSIEVNIGIKGAGGIPFIAQGETNGAIKVTAKWKKD